MKSHIFILLSSFLDLFDMNNLQLRGKIFCTPQTILDSGGTSTFQIPGDNICIQCVGDGNAVRREESWPTKLLRISFCQADIVMSCLSLASITHIAEFYPCWILMAVEKLTGYFYTSSSSSSILAAKCDSGTLHSYQNMCKVLK